MADRQARGSPRKASVGDQRARGTQPLRLEIAGRIEHFLHPRPALRPFVADPDHVARLDLPGQDAGDRCLLAFIDLRSAGDLEDRVIDPSDLHDTAVPRALARQPRKPAILATPTYRPADGPSLAVRGEALPRPARADTEKT